MNMPSSNRVEVVTSVERRRRWTAYEKREIVEETYRPGMRDIVKSCVPSP